MTKIGGDKRRCCYEIRYSVTDRGEKWQIKGKSGAKMGYFRTGPYRHFRICGRNARGYQIPWDKAYMVPGWDYLRSGTRIEIFWMHRASTTMWPTASSMKLRKNTCSLLQKYEKTLIQKIKYTNVISSYFLLDKLMYCARW